MKNLTTEVAEKQGRTAEKKHIRLSENEVTEIIIGCARKVHNVLGPGLSKTAYEECMGYALGNTILEIERRKPLSLIYEDVNQDNAYQLDFIANKKVILEIKSGYSKMDIHLAKIRACLRLSGCKAGLLIDFGAENLTDGLKRVMNNNYRCRSLRIDPALIS